MLVIGVWIVGGFVLCNLVLDEILMDYLNCYWVMWIESGNFVYFMVDLNKWCDVFCVFDLVVVIDVVMIEIVWEVYYVLFVFS